MNADAAGDFVGINWGSSNFRAYLIGTDGAVRDTLESPAGVATLQRAGMIDMTAQVHARWPRATRVYAAGMIGSNIGWLDAGYVDAPAGLAQICAGLKSTSIGALNLSIVPGVACTRMHDGAPDIMRGEETELFGLMASGRLQETSVIALPGTHTKWVSVGEGQVREFMTAMSGELHDRLSCGGALASVVSGAGEDGPAFREGVRTAASRALGLGSLLFGVRARVIRGVLPAAEASSYLRGVLIGAEIADALQLFPHLSTTRVPLIGSQAACGLYRAALQELGVAADIVPSADAVVRGFVEIDLHRHSNTGA